MSAAFELEKNELMTILSKVSTGKKGNKLYDENGNYSSNQIDAVVREYISNFRNELEQATCGLTFPKFNKINSYTFSSRDLKICQDIDLKQVIKEIDGSITIQLNTVIIPFVEPSNIDKIVDEEVDFSLYMEDFQGADEFDQEEEE